MADMGHEKIVFQGPIFLGLEQLELGGPLFTSGHFCWSEVTAVSRPPKTPKTPKTNASDNQKMQ